MCRWNEDLRFRREDSQEVGNAMMKIVVKDARGSAINVGRSVIGKASIDASIILGELDRLRAPLKGRSALKAGAHL
jgi:hypothetical protein